MCNYELLKIRKHDETLYSILSAYNSKNKNIFKIIDVKSIIETESNNTSYVSIKKLYCRILFDIIKTSKIQ